MCTCILLYILVKILHTIGEIMNNVEDIFASLVPRSTDTIETFYNTQIAYSNMCAEVEANETPIIFPCLNLQKQKQKGLSGIMTEVNGENTLQTLDMLTEKIFAGISVVQVHVTDVDCAEMQKNKDCIDAKLQAYMTELQVQQSNQAPLSIDQVFMSFKCNVYILPEMVLF